MYSLSRKGFLAGGVAAALLMAVESQAATIQFTASDLADTTSGEDLWQYAYTVTGTFAAFTGFEILFDPTQFGALQEPGSGVPGWLTTVIQPDPGLPAEGLLTAAVDAPDPSVSPAGPFLLNVVWLGNGAPGTQAFHEFDDAFNVTFSGTTTGASAVPLPAAGLLLGTGLVSLWRAARRRSV
jgi:hypothetical protein